MGIGGGGFPELGLKALMGALDEGLTIEWADVDEIADDTWTASVYETGTIAPLTPDTKAEIERLGLEPRLAGTEMEVALQELANYAGVTIGAVVPVELGGDSTPFPLVAAARLGLPVVDGDYCGRAVPEEMQGTPYLYEKNIHPFASVDRWGNVCILKDAANFHTVERIQKMLSVAAYGSCHLADTLLSGKEMKEIVIRDTLTYSFELGVTVREARDRGEDPVDAIVDFTGGWLLFTGEVECKEWEDREGYMWGTTWVKGKGDSTGRVFRYWFKNENHISWLDDEPLVTTPDLIAVVDQNTGEGRINTNIEPGDHVAVVGIKGPEVFRSERGLSGAGPGYFGFDIDYVPIEERMISHR
jgi:hypothetical protein